MASTGAGGRLFITTPVGEYAIPERWQEKRIPTIYELAQFLAGPGRLSVYAAAAEALQKMTGPEWSEDARQNAQETWPRTYTALYHWQRLVPLVPVHDAHGPTMRQLLDALNEAYQ